MNIFFNSFFRFKTFEKREHQGNIGDIYGYDALSRLTKMKFNSPEPEVPDTSNYEKMKDITLDKLDNITKITESKLGVDPTIKGTVSASVVVL